MMLTQAQYAVYRDMTEAPGKFENCAPYVPYYYEQMMLGLEDDTFDDHTTISRFNITEQDRALWPILADVAVLYLWEDNNGFIYSLTEDAESAGEWQALAESEAEPDYDEMLCADNVKLIDKRKLAKRDALADFADDDE